MTTISEHSLRPLPTNLLRRRTLENKIATASANTEAKPNSVSEGGVVVLLRYCKSDLSRYNELTFSYINLRGTHNT
eukprot:scaffold1081_cov197-Alexandrium_tamarense.AAC.5